jgi:L-ascorbate metabolism protein UlaG (beta-lactamase superfamily)
MTLSIAFAGHTTMLLQNANDLIVTDPNFSLSSGLITRRDQAVFDPFLLHSAKAVLVTSAHFHRLNFPSYKYFQTTCPFLIPEGIKSLCEGHANGQWTEMKPRAEFNAGSFRILALPAAHTGARVTSLRFTGSLHYLIRTGNQTIFYGGDTAYTRDFAEIGAEFAIDAAILPIDAIGPESWRMGRYLTPENALRAFKDLKAKRFIPNAFGSYAFGNRDVQDCLKRLRQLVVADGIQAKLSVLAPGEKIEIV